MQPMNSPNPNDPYVTTPPPPEKKNTWVWGLAAVVVVVVGIFALTARDPGVPTGTEMPPAATETPATPAPATPAPQ